MQLQACIKPVHIGNFPCDFMHHFFLLIDANELGSNAGSPKGPYTQDLSLRGWLREKFTPDSRRKGGRLIKVKKDPFPQNWFSSVSCIISRVLPLQRYRAFITIRSFASFKKRKSVRKPEESLRVLQELESIFHAKRRGKKLRQHDWLANKNCCKRAFRWPNKLPNLLFLQVSLFSEKQA